MNVINTNPGIEKEKDRIPEEIKKLIEMNPNDFEELIVKLLAELGVQRIEATQKTDENGIEEEIVFRGTVMISGLLPVKMAVFVRQWQADKLIQLSDILLLRGDMCTYEHGLIITTSDFNFEALEETFDARKMPLSIMNGKKLVEYLKKYNLGFQTTV